MPSFTLLGPTVIKLEFIVHSSYPHEILHNWWGNGVFVNSEKGNWCEGLTAYLADHLVQEQRGAGSEYRRSTLQKYRDYVHDGRDFPLTEFRERHSAATEAVGYGKALMMDHMLRRRIGDDVFRRAGWILSQSPWSARSWDDVRAVRDRAGAVCVVLSAVDNAHGSPGTERGQRAGPEDRRRLCRVRSAATNPNVGPLCTAGARHGPDRQRTSASVVNTNVREQTFDVTVAAAPHRCMWTRCSTCFACWIRGRRPVHRADLRRTTDPGRVACGSRGSARPVPHTARRMEERHAQDRGRRRQRPGRPARQSLRVDSGA